MFKIKGLKIFFQYLYTSIKLIIKLCLRKKKAQKNILLLI